MRVLALATLFIFGASTTSLYAEIDDDCGAVLSKPPTVRVDSKPKEQFYDLARQFAETYGIQYAKYILSHRSLHGNTNLVIALNGAEHLGNFLRIYMHVHKITDISIIPLYLNRKIVGPHLGSVPESKLGMVPKLSFWLRSRFASVTGRKLEEKNWYEIGYGPGFEPQFAPQETYGEKPGNTFSELQEYLAQNKVPKADKVLVIDTGFRGTIPFAVRTLLKAMDYPGQVEGLLFFKNGDPLISPIADIYGFNEVESPTRTEDLYRWMYLFEEGMSARRNAFSFFSDPTVFRFEGREAFLPSRPSPPRLLKGADGIWVPSTSAYSRIETFQNDTERGFWDGLTNVPH